MIWPTMRVMCVAIALGVFASLAGPLEGASVEIYGRDTGQRNIKDLGPWGSGTIELDAAKGFVKIDTDGYYQGGRFDLAPGISLDEYAATPDNSYLLLEVSIEPRAGDPAPNVITVDADGTIDTDTPAIVGATRSRAMGGGAIMGGGPMMGGGGMMGAGPGGPMMGPGMMGPGGAGGGGMMGPGMMGPGMMGSGGGGMMGPGMMGPGGQAGAQGGAGGGGMMGPGMMGPMMGPMMGQAGQQGGQGPGGMMPGMMGPMMGQGGQQGGQGPGGMMPGMMGQGGVGGGMMGPGAGMMGGMMAQAPKVKPRVDRLRILLFTDQGTYGAEEIDAFGVPVSPQPVDSGWGRVYVPLSAFDNGGRGVPKGELQRVLICGNGDDTVNIRSLSLFQEDPAAVITPVPDEDDVEVDLYDTATLTTKLEGANHRATVYWDFDKSDGITVQGMGEMSSARFNAPGSYTVTIIAEPTVGTAAPRTATMRVVVPEPQMGQGMMGPGGMGPGMMGPGGMGPGMMGPGGMGPGMMGPGGMGPGMMGPGGMGPGMMGPGGMGPGMMGPGMMGPQNQ